MKRFAVLAAVLALGGCAEAQQAAEIVGSRTAAQVPASPPPGAICRWETVQGQVFWGFTAEHCASPLTYQPPTPEPEPPNPNPAPGGSLCRWETPDSASYGFTAEECSALAAAP